MAAVSTGHLTVGTAAALCRKSMPKVAVLFARADSVYKTLTACDVYDEDRDARTFRVGVPVIAHPPCRAWGQLRQFAKPVPGEKDLARFAVRMVRENGGVLEHPKSSKLWEDQGLPDGMDIDEHGGFTIHIDQFWWGHKAKKSTRLYICGCSRPDLPLMPINLGYPEYVVDSRKHDGTRKWITKKEREATPPLFAKWLFDLALSCGGHNA